MKTLWRFLSPFITAFVIVSCAGQAPPPGGPEDTVPPQIISVYPAPYTVFYADKRIVFEFDEFVDRNSVRESIFISPYIGELEFDWSGKEVEIGFSAALRENTTYVVNVGTDVRDLNRGNRMAQAFTLAFSTGAAIDRGAITGTVYSIQRGEQATGVMMFAFQLNGMDRDTLDPKTSEPDYITQTGANGTFFFRHLSLGWYRIIALRDEYRNFVYDPETDEYGLLQHDLELTETDTLVSGLELQLAKEDTTAPRLVRILPINGQLLTAEFSEPIDTSGIGPWNFAVVDTVSGDSLRVLAASPRVPQRKEVMVVTEKQETGRGYSMSVSNVRDPVGLSISPLANSLAFEGSGVPDTTVPFVREMTFKDSLRGLPLDPVLLILFSEPLKSVPWDSVVMFRDTLGRTLAVNGRWAGNAAIELKPSGFLTGMTWYKLAINAGMLSDIPGNTGKDTVLSYHIQTIDPERFSGIEGRVLSAEGADTTGTVVIRAYDLRQKTVSGLQTIPGDGPFLFERLVEGQYVLEAFRDRNRNGSYDPGSVFPFRPSERFTVYPDTLRLRARWPVEGVKIELR